jgi:hypothetical protein
LAEATLAPCLLVRIVIIVRIIIIIITCSRIFDGYALKWRPTISGTALCGPGTIIIIVVVTSGIQINGTISKPSSVEIDC